MSFDKWFNNQSLLIKVVLLILPFVGWIVEFLIRLSVALDKKDVISIVVFLLFLFLGWSWIIVIIDLVYLIIKGHLLFA